MNFLLTPLIFFSFSASLFAQSDEHTLLFDSLANVTVNQISKIDLIAATQEVVQIDTAADPFLTEVHTVLAAREMMRALLPIIYGNCTPEQLRELMRFTRSESNQRIMSEQVTASMAVNIVADILKMLENQTMNKRLLGELPTINDKEYDALVDEYLLSAGTTSILNEMTKILQQLAANNDVEAQLIQDLVDILRERSIAYFKDALVDYVTKEHLREAIAFYKQPYMRQMMQGIITSPAALLNGVDNPNTQLAIEYMQAKVGAIQYLDTAVLFTDSMVAINNHIAFISSKPLVKDIEPIYPIMTLTLKKKQIYVGQTRDGIPHGKGELTDKKGNRYSGDFRNGMRHGLITQYSPNGDSITQLWVGDVLQKNPNISLERPVAYYDGKPIGYGYYYNSIENIRETGFFNGALEGVGERIHRSNNMIETGKFKDGLLVKGYITQEANNINTEHKGEFIHSSIGVVTKGVATIEAMEQGEIVRVMQKGTIIDSQLFGDGVLAISNVRNTILEEGYFAYGQLYGKGRKTNKWNNGSMIEVYDGNFFAGKYHGHGMLNTTKIDTDSVMISSLQIQGNYQHGKLQGPFVADYMMNIDKLSSAQKSVQQFGFKLYGNQFVHLDSDTLKMHIEGNVKHDKLDGEAEIILSNGNYYKGTFDNGYFVRGTARITYSDGSIYEGELLSNRFDGKGKYIDANGMISEGTFKQGVCVKGVYKNKRGIVIARIK